MTHSDNFEFATDIATQSLKNRLDKASCPDRVASRAAPGSALRRRIAEMLLAAATRLYPPVTSGSHAAGI